MANKLSRKHLCWKKSITNVKLATQSLSASVVTALFHLEQRQNADFTGFKATAKFTLILNNILDLLNSKSLYAYGLKKP